MQIDLRGSKGHRQCSTPRGPMGRPPGPRLWPTPARPSLSSARRLPVPMPFRSNPARAALQDNATYVRPHSEEHVCAGAPTSASNPPSRARARALFCPARGPMRISASTCRGQGIPLSDTSSPYTTEGGGRGPSLCRRISCGVRRARICGRASVALHACTRGGVRGRARTQDLASPDSADGPGRRARRERAGLERFPHAALWRRAARARPCRPRRVAGVAQVGPAERAVPPRPLAARAALEALERLRLAHALAHKELVGGTPRALHRARARARARVPPRGH